MEGLLKAEGLFPNPFLWIAVDDFKAQGYTINAIEKNEMGNKRAITSFM